MCLNVQRISFESITCDYPEGGPAGCTERSIYVRIAGQRTEANDIQLCHVEEGATAITGIPTADSITEGGTYPEYDITLQISPADGKTLTVSIMSVIPVFQLQSLLSLTQATMISPTCTKYPSKRRVMNSLLLRTQLLMNVS